MNTLRFALCSLSLLVTLAPLAGCGRVIDDRSEEPSGTDPDPTPVDPPTTLPDPEDTVFADASTPARRSLGRASEEQAERCSALQIGADIPSLPDQGAWEASLAGSRLLGTGQLVAGHHFNEILGLDASKLYVSTWGGMLDDLYGIVAIDLETGEATEHVSRGGAHYFARTGLSHEGRVHFFDERGGSRLLRIDDAGVTQLAELPEGYFRLRSTTAGLFLSGGTSSQLLLRWSGELLEAIADTGSEQLLDFDAAPDGRVVYAAGRRLYLTGREAPLVEASGKIVSVRVDGARGEVVFSVEGEGPHSSSVFALGAQGIEHVLEARRWQSQDTELPLRMVEAHDGNWTLAMSCSNDEDAPDSMPLRYAVDYDAAIHVVDDPAYPYVTEYARMLEVDPYRIGPPVWRASDGAPRFFLRR